MVEPRFLQALFTDTHDAIKQQIDRITHSDSVRQPPFDGNCINWILGHIVVARCNFLMMLDVPSIWGMTKCRRYIPGSAPVTGIDDATPFDSLLADLDRTQDQLVTALSRVSAKDLDTVKDDQSIGEHLISYHAHESYHLGQFELLRQLLSKEASA
ncbi:MAG: DinB family protein [Chloroflexi bacterium]|nr:DinB family protein [Chloroflexota bacterium]